MIGAVLALFQGRWLASLRTAAIAAITFLPVALGRRFRVRLPAEMELMVPLRSSARYTATTSAIDQDWFLGRWIQRFTTDIPDLFRRQGGDRKPGEG